MREKGNYSPKEQMRPDILCSLSKSIKMEAFNLQVNEQQSF